MARSICTRENLILAKKLKLVCSLGIFDDFSSTATVISMITIFILAANVLNGGVHLTKPESTKLLHEEIALQWGVTSGSARESAMTNSW